MLLSDEEIKAIQESGLSGGFGGSYKFARTIEAAILAKLQAMEMPEPAELKLMVIGVNHSYENVGERSFTEAGFVSAAKEIYKLGQAQAHAIGYAKGAAEQLSAEPSGYLWHQRKKPVLSKLEFQQDPSIQLKALGYVSVPLYTRKKAK